MSISTKSKKVSSQPVAGSVATGQGVVDGFSLFSHKAAKRQKKSKTVSSSLTIHPTDDETNDDNLLVSLTDNVPPQQQQHHVEDSIRWNTKKINPDDTFDNLGVAQWLVTILTNMNIRKPTEIQHRCLPAIFSGNNVIGRAKTGSGKTAAFALPIIQSIAADPYGIFALVLTPTRELAYQICDQFDVFGTPLRLETCVIVGGMDMMKQVSNLEQRPHVLIATPGRLSDLLVRGGFKFHANYLKFLVFDEADRLFDPCFQPFIQTIIEHIPPASERQTLMFSATITSDIINTQSKNSTFPDLIPNPVYLRAADDDDNLVDRLLQQYILVPELVKECYLFFLLQFARRTKAQRDAERQLLKNKTDKTKDSLTKSKSKKGKVSSKIDADLLADDDENGDDEASTLQNTKSAIIFVSRKETATFLSHLLGKLGIPNSPLHSGVKQAHRMTNLGKFRSGYVQVLVATDVAARGLDIPQVSLVVNYDIPRTVEDYIHRVGRTARAGRDGQAVTFITQNTYQKIYPIEEGIGVKLAELSVDEEKALEHLKMVNQTKKVLEVQLQDEEVLLGVKTTETPRRRPQQQQKQQ